MNYIELINAFWEQDESWQFSSIETRLYFYLLKTANRQNWRKNWERADEKVATDVGISPKTMKNARKKLEEAEMIQVSPGGKGRGTKTCYEILPPRLLFKGRKKRASNVPPKGQPKGIPNGIPYSAYIGTRDKPKQKQKQKDNSNELSAEGKLPQNLAREKQSFQSPGLEEVENYFNGRLPDWEMQARLFYYHFEGVGWRTASGTKIRDWESKADYWITEKIAQQDEKRNNNHTAVQTGNPGRSTGNAPGSLGDLEGLADAILGGN